MAGEQAAFGELAASRDGFFRLLDRVTQGGEIDGVEVPASSGPVQPTLQQLDTAWGAFDKNVSALLAQDKALRAAGELARALFGGIDMVIPGAHALQVFGEHYRGLLIAILPPGAFIFLGLLVAARNAWVARAQARASRPPAAAVSA